MSDAKVRNAADGAWITLTTANTKIRNAANTGWIPASAENFKVRNATNTGWLSFFGGGGGGVTITSMSVSPMLEHMNVSGAAEHRFLSDGITSYGLWLDSPNHPYRDASGNLYITCGHSENYRFLIPDLNNPYSWVLQGMTLNSAREAPESAYNNRHWLFAVWANGNTMYAIMHHEWYMNTYTVDGIPGNNSNNPTYQRHAITWAQSTNGGASFAVSPTANSTRCIMIPEPSGVQPAMAAMNGWLHPSNIVQEGSYYYATVEQRSLVTSTTVNQGVSLIRTTNPGSPTGWEFWNGSAWEQVNHASYQGNLSYQQPHRFFPTNGINIAVSGEYVMIQSIRKHVPSGKWVLFGYFGGVAGYFVYATMDSLANPAPSALNVISNANQEDFISAGGRWISVFDPASPDQNLQTITGNTATVLVTRNYNIIKKGTLTINVS